MATKIRKLKKAPKGWVNLRSSTTAPRGYEWYSNGKSRFKSGYRHALVKISKKK